MEILRVVWVSIYNFAQEVLSDPFLWILGIIILVSQYKRLVTAQKIIYGEKIRYSLSHLVATSILAGTLGGMFASILISVLGITFYSVDGLLFTIFLSFIFLIINPKHLRLSYSAGILGLLVLILNNLSGIGLIDKNNALYQLIYNNFYYDISALMAFVALLHLIESILIWLDGYRGAVPVFMKKNSKIVGAFIMHRLWVVPVIVFAFIKELSMSDGAIATPSWWPLFSPSITQDVIKNAIFAPVALIAILGYGDMALTTTPKKKVRKAMLLQLVYSFILLALALLSVKSYPLKYAAVLYAILGYEAMTAYEVYLDGKESPLFSLTDAGIRIVDTIPEAPAAMMGLTPGEIIEAINDIKVRTIEEIDKVLDSIPNFVWVDVLDLKGKKRVVEYKNYVTGIKNMGIITIPQSLEDVPHLDEKENIIKRWKRRIK